MVFQFVHGYLFQSFEVPFFPTVPPFLLKCFHEGPLLFSDFPHFIKNINENGIAIPVHVILWILRTPSLPYRTSFFCHCIPIFPRRSSNCFCRIFIFYKNFKWIGQCISCTGLISQVRKLSLLRTINNLFSTPFIRFHGVRSCIYGEFSEFVRSWIITVVHTLFMVCFSLWRLSNLRTV